MEVNRLKVVTAPERYNLLNDNSVSVFLAGGITNCHEWQSDVIEELAGYINVDFEIEEQMINTTILNPRRCDFNVNDPNAEYEQISWEHRMLSKCDIVSFFFDNSESLQPITLYELGKYSMFKPYVVSIVTGYKRKNDILIQKNLDGALENIMVYDTYEEAICGHAGRILKCVKGEAQWK